MTTKDIEERLQREPFLPLRIFVSDGQVVDITRPRSVAVGRNGLFIVLEDDRWKWIPIRHISRLETLQAA